MKHHIAIIDGTLSRLEAGQETHAGKLFKLAHGIDGKKRSLHYDPGVQGQGLYKWAYVASGAGLNLSIQRIYRRLSEVYREGDALYLLGYSRGAYAIRLVADMISTLGLLKREYATRALAESALKLHNLSFPPIVRRDFCAKYCVEVPKIAFLGVWDTVRALGLPIPFIHHLAPLSSHFNDHAVPSKVRIARHALAKDEDRLIFAPELWRSASPETDLVQMLFAGDHGVVGGHIVKDQALRKLANFSFIWMGEELERAGLILPGDWRERFPCDPHAEGNDDFFYDRFIWRREERRFRPPEYYEYHPSIMLREAGR